MSRLIFCLLAFGLIIQGCTVQKRTLMPGWHVERSGHFGSSAGDPIHEASPGETVAEVRLNPDVSTPVPLEPLIPVKALMAFSPPKEMASEPRAPGYARRLNPSEPQKFGEVALSADVQPIQRRFNEGGGKEQLNSMHALAALLAAAGLYAVVAALRPAVDDILAVLGIGLVTMAWKILRSASPKHPNQLSNPQEPAPVAAAELPPEPAVEEKSVAMRIALGALALVLGWCSVIAFIFAFIDVKPRINAGPFIVGIGLLALTWRALQVAFPGMSRRLRNLLKIPSRTDAVSTVKQESSTTTQPNRDWLWLLAIIPVILIILAVSSFSFPGFGM